MLIFLSCNIVEIRKQADTSERIVTATEDRKRQHETIAALTLILDIIDHDHKIILELIFFT